MVKACHIGDPVSLVLAGFTKPQMCMPWYLIVMLSTMYQLNAFYLTMYDIAFYLFKIYPHINFVFQAPGEQIFHLHD